MEFVRAAILGIVQGLTEFLPVSSSGHLVLIPALFGWEDQGLSFDVGLHLGTLLAILGYFWRDWVEMVRVGTADLARYQFRFSRHRRPSQFLWLIALGSVPAAVVGFLFNDWIEEHVRQPWLIAITLAAVGAVMLYADSRGTRARTMSSIGVVDAVVIGVAQACALIPGVSRSGATITTGLFRGLDRNDAARFAFLLGTPAFVGAALLKGKDLASETSTDLAALGVGFICSAVVGFLVIHFLLRYLRTRSLAVFVWYRFGVAALTLVIAGIRVA
ncbi:MAG: undecaprenyl-diphosphatase UppP [Dehalococcoidia bacterium]|nr:undecaprenyl-diphosphatase UppP [Dehalococcoidia bacterium]